MSKITVNHQDKALTNMELRHKYLPENFQDYSQWCLPKIYVNR